MLNMQWWEHERSVLARERGCIAQDQVSFSLRRPLAPPPGLEQVMGSLLQALFRHRHRHLIACFAQQRGEAEEGGSG